jgi:hypothetical protein
MMKKNKEFACMRTIISKKLNAKAQRNNEFKIESSMEVD